MTALLAYDRKELISRLPEKPFTEPDNNIVGQLISSIKASVDTRRRFDGTAEMRAVIWNEKARHMISQHLGA